MKKTFWFLCALLLLVGCTNSAKLNDVYDEKAIDTKAREAVTHFVDRNYDQLRALGDENFKEVLTDEVLDEARKTIEQSGAWVEMTDVNVSGLKKDDKDYAVAVCKAKFEKENHVFTVIFVPESQVTGFFVK